MVALGVNPGLLFGNATVLVGIAAFYRSIEGDVLTGYHPLLMIKNDGDTDLGLLFLTLPRTVFVQRLVKEPPRGIILKFDLGLWFITIDGALMVNAPAQQRAAYPSDAPNSVRLFHK